MNSIALLEALLKRAESERDTAQSVLQQAEAERQRARAQAAQLTSYQQDFDQRWTAHFRQAGTRELLDCRQSFGERLEQAISGQQDQVEHLGNRVERARAALLEREQRVAAVGKLIQRRRAELARLQQRQQQRSDDELAQRLHRQRSGALPG